MKTQRLLALSILFTAFYVCGQGFIYDQSSATNTGAVIGDYTVLIQDSQPMGQSFTPSLSAIGFVQLKFADGLPANGIGTSVYVNLWSGSISSGTLLGSTAPVAMPDGIDFGITNFYFPIPVSLTPGTTYYLQPVTETGDAAAWEVIASGIYEGTGYNYPGGVAIFNGVVSTKDLWFREGIVVPEPSAVMLGLLGSGVFLYARSKRKGISTS